MLVRRAPDCRNFELEPSLLHLRTRKNLISAMCPLFIDFCTLTIASLTKTCLFHCDNVVFFDGIFQPRHRSLVIIFELIFDIVRDVQMFGVSTNRIFSVKYFMKSFLKKNLNAFIFMVYLRRLGQTINRI